MLKLLLYIVIAFGLWVIIGRFILFPLPEPGPDAAALPAGTDTPLGRRHAETSAAHPDLTGVLPLADGKDALGSRLVLIGMAEASIDAQYYIWHDDISGMLLLAALKRAAERGVRVRLLLDDNGIPGMDSHLAALNALENFSIRLYNPSTIRKPKILGYTLDFMRMNRRMHNKALIVDGAAAIIGGRNIGDAYFEIGEQFYFDMDVFAAGQIVPETATAFDSYWNSGSVFPLERIIAGPGDMAGFMARLETLTSHSEAGDLIAGLESTVESYVDGVDLEWTQVQLVVDDPVKGEGTASRDQLMLTRLGAILGDVQSRLDLVSAYFIPGKLGTRWFTDLAGRGVEVNILTNAMNTTDVLLVHAGYTRYRRALLEGGVRLFELKLRSGMESESDLQIKPLGLSGGSLHAKTFAVDDRRIFIGSFNFDPRSAMLNTEMGFLIDSPDMATSIREGFDGTLASVSYQPALTPEGNMIWREGETIYQQEPGTSWFKQMAIAMIGVLPVEWLL